MTLNNWLENLPVDDSLPDYLDHSEIRPAYKKPYAITPQASDFGVFKLAAVLDKFDVRNFEGGECVQWYWDNAHKWGTFETQEKFDQVARKKISDHVGYTRKCNNACSVVERLYDKAASAAVEFDEVIDAIAFLDPSVEIPDERIDQRQSETLIDISQRRDFLKFVRIDNDFLATMRRLFPVDIHRVGHRDVLCKRIHVGNYIRDYPIHRLVWWKSHPLVSPEELNEALETRNGNGLDLRLSNWFSVDEAAAQRKAESVPKEYRESESGIMFDSGQKPVRQKRPKAPKKS